MMGKAGRVIGLYSGLAAIAVVLVVCAGLFVANQIEQQHNANYAKALVESLSAANTADVKDLVVEISEYQQWATPLLKEIVADEHSSPTAKLHASLVLVKDHPSQVEFLSRQLLTASPDDLPVIVSFLEPQKKQLNEELWVTIRSGSNSQRIRAAAALAQYDGKAEQWEQECEDVVTALVSVPAAESDEWIEMLSPVGSILADPLERRFRDRSEQRNSERTIVAAALSVYLKHKPENLTPLILLADNEHYHSGIGLLTPALLHYGLAEEIILARTSTLSLAHAAKPERFVNGVPKPAPLPTAAWINPPAKSPINEKRPPEIHCPEGPPEASLTHPRSGYPSAGCVPAEPASVSPNEINLTNQNTLNTRVMPEKIPGVRGLAPEGTPLIH